MNKTTAIVRTGPAGKGLLFLLALLCGLAACSRDPASRLELAQQKVADNDYVTAIIELKNLLQSSPDNIEARLLLSEVSLALGDPLAAEKELNAAIDLGAEASAQTALHYDIQLTLGSYAGILEALDLDGGTEGLSESQAIEIRALALLGLGSSIEAESRFRRVLEIDIDSARARWGLAGALDKQGRTEEVQAEIQKLITEHPNYSRGWVLNGQMALRDGRLEGAADSFRLAVLAAQQEPDRISEMVSLTGLADAQLGLQDLEGAEQTINQLRSFAGGNPMTRLLVARLAYGKQDFVTAAAELERALNSNPGDLRAMLLLGAVNMAQGNFSQAELVLSKVIALAPDNRAAHKLLAQTQMRLSRPEAAIETLGPLLEQSEIDAQISVFASQALLSSGNVGEAIELLKKTLAAEPDNVDVALRLGATYLAARRNDEAITLLESLPVDDVDYRRELMLAMAYTAEQRSEEADAQIESILAQHGDQVEVLNLAGRYFLGHRELDIARGHYQKALVIDSGNIATRLRLAYLEMQALDHEASREVLEPILDIDPENLPALMFLADLAARDNRLDDAVSLLLTAIASNPEESQPQEMLARAYARQGDGPRAERTIREAVRLAPENLRTLTAAGETMLDLGKFREALGFYRRAVEISPQSGIAYYNLSRAQMALGARTDSRASLEKSIELDPNAMSAPMVLAVMEMRDGYPEKALEITDKLREKHPENPAVYAMEGDVLMALDRMDEASRAYRRAYAIRPVSPVAIRAYQAGSQAGKTDSHDLLESWLADNPDDGTVITILAQYHQAQGDTDLAKRGYQRAIEINENNFMAMNNLAWMYFEAGDNQAESLARKAVELAPESGPVVDTLGWILLESGQFEEGTRRLEAAAELSPDVLDIRYHLAVAKSRQGETVESIRILNEILADERPFGERENAEELLAELETQS
ncbi:MAG: PEP-CTERM system TPR-repeat protein PrsT [Gammaproteobacteria bacterium]|nr:PEP-CTERM system TPR-repeat protein PrsT [Gammaproteobacteria bacterium]